MSEIDEHLVDQFTVWALAKDHARKRGQPLQRGTVNRWCSTLKKALRMARRWKLIEVVPDIPRLDGERERTFVFTDELRRKYNELAPEPLNSFVQLSCENGICEGEAIALLKKDVHLQEQADEWGHYGYITIRDGKTEYRKRSLPITQRARSILQSWIERSKCDLVFTREDGLTPVSKWTLIQQQDRMRKLLDLPWDAVIHSGRHTGLTNLGMAGADAFTIKSIAGHASVTTSQKYVHPTPESVSRAFQRKAQYEEKVVTMPKRKRGQAVRAAAARKS